MSTDILFTCRQRGSGKNYSVTQARATDREKKFVEAARKVTEFESLHKQAQTAMQSVNYLSSILQEASSTLSPGEAVNQIPTENVPLQLTRLRESLKGFFRDATHQKRVAATHIMVFMISDSLRRREERHMLTSPVFSLHWHFGCPGAGVYQLD